MSRVSAVAAVLTTGCAASSAVEPRVDRLVSEFETICVDTYPGFAGAEDRLRALGFRPSGRGDGQFRRPEARPSEGLTFDLGTTRSGRAACTALLPRDVPAERVIATLSRTLGVSGAAPGERSVTLLPFGDGFIGVAERSLRTEAGEVPVVAVSLLGDAA